MYLPEADIATKNGTPTVDRRAQVFPKFLDIFTPEILSLCSHVAITCPLLDMAAK